MRTLALLALILALVPGCPDPAPRDGGPAEPEAAPAAPKAEPGEDEAAGPLAAGEEARFASLKRVTAGGSDAEAYFSADGSRLVFQSTRGEHEYDQIYVVGTDGTGLTRVSPGPGKTTCSFFAGDGTRIVYSTTHFEPDAELRKPDPSKKEAWILDPAFEVVSCALDGSDCRRLTESPGYDAESVASRADGRIVFCSTRTGDPELFIMDADGSNLKQLTDEKGYDGGPFFSVDGTKIIYRTYQPVTPEQVKEYDDLIARNAVSRWPLDIWMMNPDGTGKTRITTRGEKTGLTCWAPYLHPDNRRIVFVSVSERVPGRMPNFDLFLTDVDGAEPVRLTFDPGFDGFPMFSDDGTRLSFVSSRQAARRGEVSIYIADWKD